MIFDMGGKILILGGGFGGIRAALDLEKYLGGRAELTLIDRNSYHLFAPLLYETASAYGLKRDAFLSQLRKTVSIPFADIFAGKNVHFIQGEIAKVDLAQRQVTTRGDAMFPYDFLVIGMGSQASDFGIPGVGEYACQFKTLDDAVMANEKITALFQEAKDGSRALPLKISIVGGGFTGVELAAEMACCSKNLAKQCGLQRSCYNVSLFEAGLKILPGISDRERDIITDRLTKLGVAIMANSGISEISSGTLRLKDGRTMRSDLIIWTAGVKPNEFLRKIEGLALSDDGKIIVDEYLRTPQHQNVFAVGDNIQFIDHKTKRSEPALAYVAANHAIIAARNITRSIREEKLIPHKPFYELWVAPVGGKFAVAHLWWGMRVSGFWGWIIRQAVDFRYLVSIMSLQKAFRFMLEDIRIFSKND